MYVKVSQEVVDFMKTGLTIGQAMEALASSQVSCDCFPVVVDGAGFLHHSDCESAVDTDECFDRR